MDGIFVLLCVLTSHQEAQLLCGLLQSRGIEAHVRGAKEYAALVTGTDLGRYEIVVPDEKLEWAKDVLLEIGQLGN